jgi:hypothetical protein
MDDELIYSPYSNWDEEPHEEKYVVKDWREAYELNKTRDTCIVCGKPTRKVALLYSEIMVCDCINSLAKPV